MITSPQNQIVKHAIKLRENKHYRQACQTVLVPGYTLVQEVAALIPPLRIFTSEKQAGACRSNTYYVSEALLKKITGLPSPEPIAAEFPLPPQASLLPQSPLLVLDAIRDPGNLGALLRTAAALGWAGVFLLPTCVDPFHEKVIRSSRAALFRLPWCYGTWDVLEVFKQQHGFTALIADTTGAALDTLSIKKNRLLVLSNEARGIGEHALHFGQKVTVPMQGNMESLNVAIAGGILMYYLR